MIMIVIIRVKFPPSKLDLITGTLDYNELQMMLNIIDGKLTSLPATAQRAHQQGYPHIHLERD